VTELVQPIAEPTDKPEPEEPKEEDDGVEGGVEGGVAGGVVGGVLGGSMEGVTPPPPPPPPPKPTISDAERKRLLREYLQDRVQPKLQKHFSYPREAELNDQEGTVMLQLTIAGDGTLVSAKVSGSCPAPPLCQAALASARAASPFPDPPPILGGQVSVIVRQQYILER
jgi:TonB family protein